MLKWREIQMYNKVELNEDVLVQYVGVYILNWKSEWGEPSVGFVEREFDSGEYESALFCLVEVEWDVLDGNADNNKHELAKITAKQRWIGARISHYIEKGKH